MNWFAFIHNIILILIVAILVIGTWDLYLIRKERNATASNLRRTCLVCRSYKRWKQSPRISYREAFAGFKRACILRASRGYQPEKVC